MTKNQAVPFVKILLASAMLAIVVGCATPGQMTEAQTGATEARQAADAAQASADEANRAAQEALQIAREALEMARSSQRCCTDLEQRLDRAIERMQAK